MRLAPLAFLPLASCMVFFDGPADEPVEIPPTEPVVLRACNATGFDFDALGYGDRQNVGPLADGACTDYIVAERVYYSYDWVRFVIGEDEFESYPIDFVGETPLAPGRWTYRLMIFDYEARQFGIAAVFDGQ